MAGGSGDHGAGEAVSRAEQLTLAVDPPQVTLCGYCLRPLVRQPAGDWSCDRCRPLLARIGRGPVPRGTDPMAAMSAEWARFQREAWADRAKR